MTGHQKYGDDRRAPIKGGRHVQRLKQHEFLIQAAQLLPEM